MLRIKLVRWLEWCGLGLLLVGCAHRAPTFSPTAVPDAKSTIFYGRFTMGHQWALHNELALWLQNVDSRKNLYVYFDADHPAPPWAKTWAPGARTQPTMIPSSTPQPTREI